MHCIINGKTREISQPLCLQEFIIQESLIPAHIVIEYNGAIIKKDRWETTFLKDGDRLEIVTFVGGG